MDRGEPRGGRLRILADPGEVDAVLVVMDGSEPDAIPVIPTAKAHSYWTHPSRIRAS
jgi:hypothetical protein